MQTSQKISRTKESLNANWVIGNSSELLNQIHQKDINIVIYERDIRSFNEELDDLMKRNIKFTCSGDVNKVWNEIIKTLDPNKYKLVTKDIKEILFQFTDITGLQNVRLKLAIIDNNMCRKFHTDINDLRLLCTYRGSGTLWLSDDNVNRNALLGSSNNDSIVMDENKVKQANTGSVILLKGALYPHEDTKAAVHRSPTIEESGEKRLLLRIDTNGQFRIY